jgi:CheY-like chemotaxis protein
VRSSEATPPETAATIEPPVTSTSRTVLVVDDDPVNQKVAQRWLQRFACDVTIARDGAEAVSMAMQRRFELILMDLQMPVMDGCEAARRIRDADQQVPIVALTGAVDEHEIAAARAAGMDDYLTKPLDADKLKAVLDRCLAAPPKQLAAGG